MVLLFYYMNKNGSVLWLFSVLDPATMVDNFISSCLQMWFQKYFFLNPDTWGDDPIWRAYFSNVVQPPPRWSLECRFTCLGKLADGTWICPVGKGKTSTNQTKPSSCSFHVAGVIQWDPFWRNETMQIYGNFGGFALQHVLIVWEGNRMTLVLIFGAVMFLTGQLKKKDVKNEVFWDD